MIQEGFFAFLENTRRPGDGFTLFGPAHLLFLAGIGAGIALVCAAYRRSPAYRQSFIRKTTASLCLGLEAVKQILLVFTVKPYPVNQFPLHLCGLCIFIEFFHAFRPAKTTAEILYSLALPGAAAALLFANWTMYPLLNFFCLQSFIIHGLHALFPLMLLVSGQLRPDPKNIWRPAVFLLVITPPIFVLNKVLDTNYLFINAGSPGSPLEILVNLLGNPGFLLGYAGLLALVWLILYLPYIIAALRKP